jgi:hypothetical protein
MRAGRDEQPERVSCPWFGDPRPPRPTPTRTLLKHVGRRGAGETDYAPAVAAFPDLLRTDRERRGFTVGGSRGDSAWLSLQKHHRTLAHLGVLYLDELT